MALIATLALSGAVMADEPTTVTVTWDGAGGVGTNVDCGDSNAGFTTIGDAIVGSYTATDSNDNPYNYKIDSFVSEINASVINGQISTGIARVNSYTGMYGNGGQVDSAFVGVSDGTASLAFRSTTNFAQMVDASYQHQLSGGHNIVVNGSSYNLDRFISDGRGNSGDVFASGTGIATLDCMSSEASGCWNLKLGRGAGCYTDANFNASGASGIFQVTGVGVDSVTFNGLGMSAGGGTLQVVANWVNNFSISDYSLTAH